jgi:hypothetical protein
MPLGVPIERTHSTAEPADNFFLSVFTHRFYSSLADTPSFHNDGHSFFIIEVRIRKALKT